MKKKKKTDLPGYPEYPASEDVYSKMKEETEVDPENPAAKKKPLDKTFNRKNEKDFGEAKSGSDLDVPGSELDEEEENAGIEDEENNFYSLGGDDHEDLEEDNQ